MPICSGHIDLVHEDSGNECPCRHQIDGALSRFRLRESRQFLLQRNLHGWRTPPRPKGHAATAIGCRIHWAGQYATNGACPSNSDAPVDASEAWALLHAVGVTCAPNEQTRGCVTACDRSELQPGSNAVGSVQETGGFTAGLTHDGLPAQTAKKPRQLLPAFGLDVAGPAPLAHALVCLRANLRLLVRQN